MQQEWSIRRSKICLTTQTCSCLNSRQKTGLGIMTMNVSYTTQIVKSSLKTAMLTTSLF